MKAEDLPAVGVPERPLKWRHFPGVKKCRSSMPSAIVTEVT